MATTQEEMQQQMSDFSDEFDKDEQEPAPVEAHEPTPVADQAQEYDEEAPMPAAEEAPLTHAEAIAQYADAHKELDAPEPKKQTFKEAFAENRKNGNKTFEWEGKKYTTEMVGEQHKPTTDAPKPAAPAIKGTHSAAMHSGASQSDVRASEPKAPAHGVSKPGDSSKPMNMHDKDIRGERMDLGKKA